AFKDEVKKRGWEGKCLVKGVGCLGPCAGGPVVLVDSENVAYAHVAIEDVPEILDVLGKGKVERIAIDTESPFFKRQFKIVLENCGKIDPDRIEDYLAQNGYFALYRSLSHHTPNEIIDEIIKSGLRGRGGAGYPTGLKWRTVAKSTRTPKYVVCNADEGDPGAFMDRSILESDPHRVLEGMAIAGYAVNANKGFVYVRAEYPLAIKRLQNAIKQAERNGVLGNSVLGTTFSFNVEIRLGAGAFVCGEETALLASIEGKRGTPRPRPPYPAEVGLFGQPTLINNVETYANIAPILRNEAEWFASIGTENSKGTKVFALAGKINNTGLIEVPMGITLREIVYEIGGGIPDGKELKAVQTGGPAGGCIPKSHIDEPVDYESLARLGSIMGSGGMIIIDETSDMVDMAKYFMDFSVSESCGKCVPCRVGVSHMYDLLEKILRGEGSKEDIDMLLDLCDLVSNTSLCGLGQAASNPVLSTLKYFPEEYAKHIPPETREDETK
ncbi:MAG: NADH-quinone oxidoreductase subunit NuoF, partial [bacterium]|nr:NADH-quinone oxidoreductase subunit NuoF [bacterium]